MLDKADIRFCPSFTAPETQDRFLAGLMPEAEQTARRLLYVVLTRARDRLILEWPLFDLEKMSKDEKGAITHARLLASGCRVSLGAAELCVGDESFAARVSHCPNEMPPEFDEAAEREPAERGYRFGRNAIIPAAPRDPGAPWLILPSSLEAAAGPLPADIRTAALGKAYDVPKELFALATERGAALHQGKAPGSLLAIMKPETQAWSSFRLPLPIPTVNAHRKIRRAVSHVSVNAHCGRREKLFALVLLMSGTSELSPLHQCAGRAKIAIYAPSAIRCHADQSTDGAPGSCSHAWRRSWRPQVDGGRKRKIRSSVVNLSST